LQWPHCHQHRRLHFALPTVWQSRSQVTTNAMREPYWRVLRRKRLEVAEHPVCTQYSPTHCCSLAFSIKLR
jgi:hypothetical protein